MKMIPATVPDDWLFAIGFARTRGTQLVPSGPQWNLTARKHLKGLQCVENICVFDRPSYFHNGFAKDLWAAVDFYDTRFESGFTKQERADLVAFVASL